MLIRGLKIHVRQRYHEISIKHLYQNIVRPLISSRKFINSFKFLKILSTLIFFLKTQLRPYSVNIRIQGEYTNPGVA